MDYMMELFYFVRNILYIFEGYVKWLFDLVTFRTSKRAKRRYSICSECEHNKKGICELCGCILKAKVRVDFLEDENGITIDGCPKRKW